MDFRVALEKLLSLFERDHVRYALIGGMALGVWGVPRGTVDVDFLVHRADMERVAAIMQALGYECRYRTENVSQYVSPLKIFGEVDFLHAFRVPSLSMLERAEVRKVFDESISVKVVKVEDLIALKVQAMANDESRRSLELSDIKSLLAMHGSTLDWDLLADYFALFGCEALLHDLRSEYGGDG